jgi:spiro-SPASM protein
MKSLIVLFAGEITGNAFIPLGTGGSAAERTLDWAFSIPSTGAVTIFARGPLDIPERYGHVSIIERERWTISELLNSLARYSSEYDAVIYGWLDCPFYDRELTLRLRERHLRYAAEYTFADGYPEGLTPELLAPGTAALLASIAKENSDPVTRDALFSVLKKDINSFEIETDIAPLDLRYLRLTLACDTKRNTLQCIRLAEEAENRAENRGTELSSTETVNAEAVTAIVTSSAQLLRTLPAFYNIQISGPCPAECSYCPYPAICRTLSGASATEMTDFMPLSAFRELVSRIADFSGDGVIALSLWGEPLLHPEFPGFVEAVLQHPSLSVLVETTGIPLTSEMADAVASIVSAAPPRTNGQNPVNWIVSIDAAEDSTYRRFRPGTGQGLEQIVTAVDMLLTRFPGMVWPQFVRMQENEEEMEPFYRFWKERSGNVIIQKYDWFCGAIPDKKSADLTPIRRNPCWHLRRDMVILVDGTVPFCKEDIYCKKAIGNVFTGPLEDIWEQGTPLFLEQLKGTYNGICGTCDEYYTFNF